MFYDPIPIYIYSQGCADDEEESGAVPGLRGGHQGAEVHAGARTEAAQVEVSRGPSEISVSVCTVVTTRNQPQYHGNKTTVTESRAGL